LNTQIPFQPATVGVQLGSYYPLANYTIIDQRYSQSTTVNADGIDGNPGNDMVVIDCNFGNNPNSSVCAKLDKLNDE
jgi:hypothetical protein